MKTNIFDRLSVWWNNHKQENKELKQIHNTFWLDLNDLDFKKYEASLPKYKEYFYSVSFLFAYIKILIYGFITYIIFDFMAYESLKLMLLNIAVILSSLGNLIVIVLLILIMLDMLHLRGIENMRIKHKLTFYRRLKKYKKEVKK